MSSTTGSVVGVLRYGFNEQAAKSRLAQDEAPSVLERALHQLSASDKRFLDRLMTNGALAAELLEDVEQIAWMLHYKLVETSVDPKERVWIHVTREGRHARKLAR